MNTGLVRVAQLAISISFGPVRRWSCLCRSAGVHLLFHGHTTLIFR